MGGRYLRDGWHWLIGTMFVSGLLGGTSAALAYTPESAEVQQLLGKALNFLDETKEHERLGGKSLMAMALIKGNRPDDHPKIQDAVAACQRAAANLSEQHRADSLYDLGLAIIFLCELDPDRYRSEITALVELLLKWQRDFGAWGYLEGQHLATGDTSMTQYAVLALWAADRTGAYPVRADAAAAVGNWLLRTQDPTGGWGYQGVDPGSFQRVDQHGVQHSLSAAGLGSVYVLGDLLGLTAGMRRKSQDNDGLPPAIRLVRKEITSNSSARRPLTDQLDRQRLRRAMESGDAWFRYNFKIEAADWVYYYMYALERYKSFRELVTGQDDTDWYDAGVEYLGQTQKPSGEWSSDCGPGVDTAFGVLFLVRGTQKTIRKAAAYDGHLRGGRGLPSAASEVRVGQDGRIVKTPFQGRAESLLAILESADDADFDATNQDIEIQLSEDPRQREQELDRLRRLVAAEEFRVRLAAIKALHSVRDLDSVPTFIYALGDPDPRIVLRARDALRLISRRIDGMGLPDDPSEAAKLDAIERWKDWFLSVRPDAQFLN